MKHAVPDYEQPTTEAERVVYGLLLGAWSMRILNEEDLNPHNLSRDLAYGHGIDSDRMLQLNYAAYKDIRDIDEFVVTDIYVAKHAIISGTLDY